MIKEEPRFMLKRDERFSVRNINNELLLFLEVLNNELYDCYNKMIGCSKDGIISKRKIENKIIMSITIKRYLEKFLIDYSVESFVKLNDSLLDYLEAREECQDSIDNQMFEMYKIINFYYVHRSKWS